MTGKKHGGLIRNIRTLHWYSEVSRILDESGAEWRVESPSGTGHPKLHVSYLGKKLTSPVPCSPHGRSNTRYIVRRVKRFLEDSV